MWVTETVCTLNEAVALVANELMSGSLMYFPFPVQMVESECQVVRIQLKERPTPPGAGGQPSFILGSDIQTQDRKRCDVGHGCYCSLTIASNL